MILDVQERGVPDREAVVAKATLRAAEKLGVSGRDLASIIGVSEALSLIHI